MRRSDSLVRRSGFIAYGALCYAIFLATFLYLMGFVGNLWHSFGWSGDLFRSMDFGGAPSPPGEALLIDAVLLGVFALQHSGMARAGFKERWTRLIPEPIERSTFVLAASLCLALLFSQWRPIGTTVLWNLSDGTPGVVLTGLSLAGWLIILLATFMISHVDLFGLRQVWHAFRGEPCPRLEFANPAVYRVVRHPIYLGFIVAIWATPIMTIGHLVFAVGMTGYILVAIRFEERDLVGRYGDAYRRYRDRTSMLLPLPPRTRRLELDDSESSRSAR